MNPEDALAEARRVAQEERVCSRRVLRGRLTKAIVAWQRAVDPSAIPDLNAAKELARRCSDDEIAPTLCRYRLLEREVKQVATRG